MMLNITKLLSLIPVLMTLMFTRVVRVSLKVELVQSFSDSVIKLHVATEMIVIVDYVRDMSVKKSCKYGEYGLLSSALLVTVLNVTSCCFTDISNRATLPSSGSKLISSVSGFSESEVCLQILLPLPALPSSHLRLLK